MDKFTLQKKQFASSLASLRDVVDRESGTKLDRLILRDSTIQRFEYTFDSAWKLLKELLRIEYGIICSAPRPCLKEAFSQHIIEDEATWLLMLETRNSTSHIYDEQNADDAYSKIRSFLIELEALKKQLTKK